MRLVGLNCDPEMILITYEMFETYIEPISVSLMCGEVPSVSLTIHSGDSSDNKEKDQKEWQCYVSFKNTLTISVFKCEIYFDDIMRLCKMNKIWLIDQDVWEIAITWSMCSALYQSQYIDFRENVNASYDSMMGNAGRAAYRFLKNHFKFKNHKQRAVLEILRYHLMFFTNHYYDGEGLFG